MILIGLLAVEGEALQLDAERLVGLAEDSTRGTGLLATSAGASSAGPPLGLKTACVESRKPKRSGQPW
jgi:hypothetical protein